MSNNNELIIASNVNKMWSHILEIVYNKCNFNKAVMPNVSYAGDSKRFILKFHGKKPYKHAQSDSKEET